MRYDHEYRSKLITAEKAATLVKSGDYVEFGHTLSKPIVTDMALAKRKDAIFDVNVHCSNALTKLHIAEADPKEEYFIYNTGHCSVSERQLMGSFGFYVPSVV